MRGRKKDMQFIGEFISECLNKQISNILEEAKSRLNQIDQQIIAAEKLKSERSKFLDVIEFLEKMGKYDKEGKSGND